MTDISKPGPKGKWEVVRRLRYGALMKLFRHRYGYKFTDDDAGREDLLVLLCVVSLAQAGADKKMAHVIEMWAPWLPADEAAEYIDRINRSTLTERMPSAKVLGDVLNLTNSERERLRLWPIKPVDMSVEQLIEQKKFKRREQERRRQRAKGVKPKSVSAKPWEADGIPRSTYYYRLDRSLASLDTNLANNSNKQAREESNLCQEGQQGSKEEKRTSGFAKISSSPDVARLESNVVDERIAALGNWGKNAEAKNISTLSPENYARGWNDLSQFDAFYDCPEQLPWCPIEAIAPFAVAFGPDGLPCGGAA